MFVLKVIEDPLSVLTSSRDRSVKLRALPTNTPSTGFNSGNDGERTSERGRASITRGADTLRERHDDSGDNCKDDTCGNNVADVDEIVSRAPTVPTLAGPENRRLVRNGPAAGVAVPGDRSFRDSQTLDNSFCTASGDNASTDNISTSSTVASTGKLPQYGMDLTTLTLGRIDDATRRDTYSFPVDLKGRGEGKAVEARAVLQVRRELRSFFVSERRRRMDGDKVMSSLDFEPALTVARDCGHRNGATRGIGSSLSVSASFGKRAVWKGENVLHSGGELLSSQKRKRPFGRQRFIFHAPSWTIENT